MLSDLDCFYENHEEPRKEIYLFLRKYIVQLHPDITEEWKYRLPFSYLRGKMFCYLWYDNHTGSPYIAFVDGVKMTNPIFDQGKGSYYDSFYNITRTCATTICDNMSSEALSLRFKRNYLISGFCTREGSALKLIVSADNLTSLTRTAFGAIHDTISPE